MGGQSIQEVELEEGREHPGLKSWILKFRGIDTVEQVFFHTLPNIENFVLLAYYSHAWTIEFDFNVKLYVTNKFGPESYWNKLKGAYLYKSGLLKIN